MDDEEDMAGGSELKAFDPYVEKRAEASEIQGPMTKEEAEAFKDLGPVIQPADPGIAIPVTPEVESKEFSPIAADQQPEVSTSGPVALALGPEGKQEPPTRPTRSRSQQSEDSSGSNRGYPPTMPPPPAEGKERLKIGNVTR